VVAQYCVIPSHVVQCPRNAALIVGNLEQRESFLGMIEGIVGTTLSPEEETEFPFSARPSAQLLALGVQIECPLQVSMRVRVLTESGIDVGEQLVRERNGAWNIEATCGRQGGMPSSLPIVMISKPVSEGVHAPRDLPSVRIEPVFGGLQKIEQHKSLLRHPIDRIFITTKLHDVRAIGRAGEWNHNRIA